MTTLNLLIKPASNKCNLKCKYCFYDDVSHNRQTSDYDYMSIQTAAAIIENVYTTPNLKQVHFGFQGGEPTLVGIDFFEQFLSMTEMKKGQIKTSYSLQTNGLIIDDQWALLFQKYNVLIGVSLDGPAKFHDSNRLDFGQRNTHAKVINATRILKEHNVDFNILTVVTNKNGQYIEKIYNYLVTNEFYYLQFIPCLNPLDYKVSNIRKVNDEYYKYLSCLFKAWSKDLKSGKYVSIRFFDNIINMILGASPEACDMRGVCSIQNVIEADGTTFACDFYALDKYIIGNAAKDSFPSMIKSSTAREFVVSSSEHPKECQSCEYYSLCRNGCRRMRVGNKYMYCDALKKFYRTYDQELRQIAFSLSVH